MDNDLKSLLADILNAINEIFDFLPEKRNFLQFREDIKTRKAIERNIEIIGEAVSKILKKQPEIDISYARKIVDTRNRIIHSYDKVSEDIIWAIEIKDLPFLQKEILKLLE